MNVLVVAAHPDDELLGVGGTVARHVAAGDSVYALILGEGQTSRDQRKQEAAHAVESLHHNTLQAADILGYSEIYFENFPDNRFDEVTLLDVVKAIEKQIHILCPSIVYTHHKGDLNIDHQITYQAVLTATRPMADCPVKELYAFETLSSTEWNFAYGDAQFAPDTFVDIEPFFENKLKAMEKYESELCEYPHPRSLKTITLSAERWGSVVGKHYVEAFETVRVVR